MSERRKNTAMCPGTRACRQAQPRGQSLLGQGEEGQLGLCAQASPSPHARTHGGTAPMAAAPERLARSSDTRCA